MTSSKNILYLRQGGEGVRRGGGGGRVDGGNLFATTGDIEC